MEDPSALPPRRHRRPGTEPEAGDAVGGSIRPPSDPDAAADSAAAETPVRGPVDLAGLSIVGITRRRVGWASTAVVAIWIVIVFARQVGQAQAATNRAAQLADDNTSLAAEVQALQSELDLIVRPEYVGIEARAYGLGNPKEIPFTLDPSVPSPVDGAPGSTSVRLGVSPDHRTPLESWLSLLFGPIH